MKGVRIMYSYQNYNMANTPYGYQNQNDRQFLFPFLVGAVTGGAAIGLTRPRPVYVNQPYYGPRPGGYGYYSNYGYYNPGYYPYYR